MRLSSLAASLLASTILGVLVMPAPAYGDNTGGSAATTEDNLCGLVDVVCDYELSVEDKIRQASRQAGINEDTAVRIARCESTLNPKAKNTSSSATGLYQFTVGTWRWIGAEKAGLDRTNPDHSIQMFVKYFLKYPSWWVCK